MCLEETPFVQRFENQGKHYFYDVNKNKVVRIGRETYDLLDRNTGLPKVPQNPEIGRLLSQGFLSPQRLTAVEHPQDTFLEDILDRNLMRVCLQVTQQCNFRCKYCVYSGDYELRRHSPRNMSWETAKAAIDFLLLHSQDSPLIDVDFFGGEPLLRFDLIQKCVEYTERRAKGKAIAFSLTTNASLITQEIVGYMTAHDVGMLVSLDGPKEINDQNRRTCNGEGTFDRVFENLLKIKQWSPDYLSKVRFSMVLDPSVQLNCVTDFLYSEQELFGNSGIIGSVLTPYYRKSRAEVAQHFLDEWNHNCFLYLLHLVGRLDRDSRLVDSSYKSLSQFMAKSPYDFPSVRPTDHHAGPCVPGQLRLFVTVDGTLVPCEKVNENSEVMQIGHLERGFDLEKVRYLLNIGKITAVECRDCFALRGCTNCVLCADGGDTLKRDTKLRECAAVRRNFLEMLKDACTLHEIGFRVDAAGIKGEEG